jgi:DNA-binding IclR family transcriptional regulator
MKSHSSVKTIDRLVQILSCFTPQQRTWSLADLSAQLGLPKPTLHRFLMSMDSYGILRRDPDDMRWRLGYRLVVWGNLAEESTDLRHVARPMVRELADATKETAILTVYHNQDVICIDKVETSHPVRLTLEVGTHRAPHAGASSKALMAHLPDKEIQAIICDKGLPKLCVNTITDPDSLYVELSRIREQGYAESHEETDFGAWGVATPIRDSRGDVVAAIGIAGPRSRHTDDLTQEYAALCRQAAGRISAIISA